MQILTFSPISADSNKQISLFDENGKEQLIFVSPVY